MITITASTVTEAAKESFIALCDYPANTSDPSILNETVALIYIQSPSIEKQGFLISEDTFLYQMDYQAYIPTIDRELVAEEERDYTELFITSGDLGNIIEHLIKFPDSRRNVISSWSPFYLNPYVTGVCITQMYFRLYNGELEVHSHARANDAYRLLLLDLQLGTSIQAEVAKAINKPVGKFVHFTDSLHFYKKYIREIELQRTYMQSAQIWK